MPGNVAPVSTPFPSAARWLSRVVFVVVVLGGVLLMHSLVLQPASGDVTDAGGGHTGMSMAVSERHGSEGPAQHRDSADCSGHSLMHMCVAMLTAVGTAMVLFLLSRVVGGEFGGRVRALLTSPVHGRAPPWSHQSLEKLSVLRL